MKLSASYNREALRPIAGRAISDIGVIERRHNGSAFLTALVAAVPYKIHTVLTDNRIQFRPPPRHTNGPTARFMTHMFDMRCRDNGIKHRCTRINHPWTNGQVERTNRTIKEA